MWVWWILSTCMLLKPHGWRSSEGATPNRAVRKSRYIRYVRVIWGLKDRHLLYLLGVAPTALCLLCQSISTALTNRPIRCRAFSARYSNAVLRILVVICSWSMNCVCLCGTICNRLVLSPSPTLWDVFLSAVGTSCIWCSVRVQSTLTRSKSG